MLVQMLARSVLKIATRYHLQAAVLGFLSWTIEIRQQTGYVHYQGRWMDKPWIHVYAELTESPNYADPQNNKSFECFILWEWLAAVCAKKEHYHKEKKCRLMRSNNVLEAKLWTPSSAYVKPKTRSVTSYGSVYDLHKRRTAEETDTGGDSKSKSGGKEKSKKKWKKTTSTGRSTRRWKTHQ